MHLQGRGADAPWLAKRDVATGVAGGDAADETVDVLARVGTDGHVKVFDRSSNIQSIESDKCARRETERERNVAVSTAVACDGV